MTAKDWTSEAILDLARGYQSACVVAAAADLEVFDVLAGGARSGPEIARAIGGDLRATTILLDALATLGLLVKSGGHYTLASGVAAHLTRHGASSVLAMAQHQANCLRRWAKVAETVRSGRPPDRLPSVRGQEADLDAFIGAMHVINANAAAAIVREVVPPSFGHLLDVGGASGTWTMAFLEACPAATATLFDLPEVIPLAERRLGEAGLVDRVRLVAGDYRRDPFPPGADLAWISAIVHQNSREENRSMLGRVGDSLAPGGRVVVRDIVMEPSRTEPPMGALFAVNMLVGTEGGGTFTFDEMREDLEAAGFERVELARREEGMSSIVVARRPAARPTAS